MKKEKILIGVTVIWVICVVLYVIHVMVSAESQKSDEIIKFLVMWVPVYGVVTSMLLMSLSSEEARKVRKERYEFDKNEITFKLIERWDMASLKEARDITRSVKGMEIDLSQREIITKVNNNDGLKRSVITMCNFFEEIYFSIHYGRVNEELLKGAFDEVYKDIYERFEVWLEGYLDEKTKKHLVDLKRRWD